MAYEPKAQDKFSFGLWTVGNIGIDPFGEPVREALSPVQLVELLAEVGAWGVNLHDNDLVPIDAKLERPGNTRACRGRLPALTRECGSTSLRLRAPQGGD